MMEQMKLTTVMHGDMLQGIPDNPPIENRRSATINRDSYGIFSPYGLSNLASSALVCAVTRNSDRSRCPLDTHPRDQGILSLIPLRDHYIYEHRYLQPCKVPAYRGRGRELK